MKSRKTPKTFVATLATLALTTTGALVATAPAYATTDSFGNQTTVTNTNNELTGSVPVVVGTPRIGGVLNVYPGEWPERTKLTYTWFADGKQTPTTASQALILRAEHVGKVITVQVTGTLETTTGTLTRSYTSEPTAPVQSIPVASSTVILTGNPTVDGILRATTPNWDANATYSYQWFVNDVAVAGATHQNFFPKLVDWKKEVKVQVTAKRAGYETVTKTSAPVKIAAGTLQVTKPVITGAPQVDKVLTAKIGVTSGAKVTYQWYVNKTLVTTSTSPNFKVSSSYVGKAVNVVTTFEKPGYNTVQDASKYVVIKKGTFTKVSTKLTGTPKVGSILKAVVNPGVDKAKVSYQWYADGKAISKATGSTFKLTKTVKNKAIQVKVTVTKTAYDTFTSTSPKTAKVK